MSSSPRLGEIPLKFAVVREDPEFEIAALAGIEHPRALLVASGGCTALALQAKYPSGAFTLVDPNPAQLAHVQSKVAALQAGSDLTAFGVGIEAGLCCDGQFESLFRGFRQFLHEFVASHDEIVAAIEGDVVAQRELLSARFWPVAFELFFSDAMLVATFGPAAVQYAEPGSYPAYFRNAVTGGLKRSAPNEFLDHVLLGHYRRAALPAFLRLPNPPHWNFEYRESSLQSISTFSGYDLVHLSNVLDWTSPVESGVLCSRIANEMETGARLTIRQLNNRQSIGHHLPDLEIAYFEGAALVARERSLFYERVIVATKR